MVRDCVIEADTHITDADERRGDRAAERVGEAVVLRDDRGDEVRLVRQPLEEQIAARSVTIGLDVNLREIRLNRRGV
jgi:hypothetical protein